MSSDSPLSTGTPPSANAAAPVTPMQEGPIHAPGGGSIRRQLESNRFANQVKRRAWETAKEESKHVCREYIRDFVQCQDGKMFSVIWACRAHNKAMTKCMMK